MFRLLGSHRPRNTCAKSASVIGALVLPLLVAPPLVPLLASVRRRPKWVAVGGDLVSECCSGSDLCGANPQDRQCASLPYSENN